jgi:hypothetical protein
MNAAIPSSYKKGIEFIQALDGGGMREWLRAELNEQSNVLTGQADDFPVQAIVNYHGFLDRATQLKFAVAIQDLVSDWKQNPGDWNQNAATALLKIIAELRIEDTKSRLKSLVESKNFSNILPILRPAVIRTLAAISTTTDNQFWNKLTELHPDFGGMAFQVLTRIAPKDALQLIGKLPYSKIAIEGVARKLPDFVSQYEGPERTKVIGTIADAIDHLPEEYAEKLKASLAEEGIVIGENNSAKRDESMVVFEAVVVEYRRGVRKGNRIREYA